MSALPFLPARRNLRALCRAAADCQGCPLYRHATQTVFGAGAAQARVMIVGEQPGDREDTEGKPFVGPAGLLLDQCLAEAGIDRMSVYVTNAVKHFKWEARGKRRIHKKPGAREIAACRPWLDAEIELIHPELLVCVGATAAQSLLGASFRVSRDRGAVIHGSGLPPVLATIHPSAILRSPNPASRAEARDGFLRDLRKAATFLHTFRNAA